MCELARDLNKIKTQFVRDRLQETKWEDRGYIETLMSLENSIELHMRGRSPGWAGGMMHAIMRKDYPVEYTCIRREMEEGIRTSLDEFVKMKADHDQEVAQRKIEALERDMQAQDEQRSREKELRKQWCELGGKC